MATSRDFVYDDQGEMLPSDSAAAATRRKELDDDARMVSDAKDAAKAPAPSAKMPTRPGQGAKPKSGIVTKEELEKSGLSLRDYMNKQRGLTRRDGATPKSKTTPPAVSSSYRSEGAGRAKPPASSGSASSTTPAAPEKRPGTALPINPGILKQREADEKKRDAARAAKRKADEAKKEKFTKDLSSDPGQVALKKERETKDTRSAAERSAARGRSIKEFFGIKKKPNLDPKGAMIQSMDTDVMRSESRAAAKAARAEPKSAREAAAKEKDKKTFGAFNRTETNRAQRETAMRDDKATYKKGGSVSSASKRADGIAQRGKTRGKVY